MRASMPVLRSLLERASDHGAKKSGVLGVRAIPEWDGPATLTHEGVTARIVPCVSPLAVRQAIRTRADDWVIVLTDHTDSELGVGIMSHMDRQRLGNPDPWDAVRTAFQAPRIDRRLVADPRAKAIAEGLAGLAQDLSLPPAPAGMLTLDHVCAAIASRTLNLPGGASSGLDDVMEWSAHAPSVALLPDLRTRAGDALADLVLDWIAASSGPAKDAVRALLVSGRAADLVPLGLVARAVRLSGQGVSRALFSKMQLPGVTVTDTVLDELAAAAESVARRKLHRRDAESGTELTRILAAADHLATEVELGEDVALSGFLPRSLDVRLERLGRTMVAATRKSLSSLTVDPHAPVVEATALDEVETAYSSVVEHTAAGKSAVQRVAIASAGVRLVRWLATPRPVQSDIGDHTHAYRDELGWVDRAYADAWRGVSGLPALSAGLKVIVEATRARRRVADSQFAQSLATYVSAGADLPTDVVPVERLFERLVVPIARGGAGVLLVVADGMSVPVGTEVIDAVQLDSGLWHEYVPHETDRRVAALSALPSLTEVSRCSLLSGRLATGGQAAEQAGFEDLLSAHHLTGVLLHKKALATSGGGHSLPHDVAGAIADTEHHQVVACVLNAIDDALDRTDPGIDWDTDAIQHLRPLLEAAGQAGRTVILTSDHGHIIERREGHVLPADIVSSNRSRPASSGPEASAEEIRVRGERVLLHEGDAVLAVDESLRYGTLKAGYHGGAAPAEVVIPVHVLSMSAPADLREAPPQAPSWWRDPLPVAIDARPAAAPASSSKRANDHPTLFDTHTAAVTDAPGLAGLADKLRHTARYIEQVDRAERLPFPEQRIYELVGALAAAPRQRLSVDSAAAILRVATARLNGALPHVQRVLNVDQYAVLSREENDVVLDVALLVEQFEVPQ